MSNPARSIMVHGIYLVLSGLSFVLFPNIVLPIFGFALTNEVWIRLVGLLAIILGGYFLNSVRVNDLSFFRATMVARVTFFIGVTLFTLLGLSSPLLILFGLIDLAGATWTWYALRQTRG